MPPNWSACARIVKNTKKLRMDNRYKIYPHVSLTQLGFSINDIIPFLY